MRNKDTKYFICRRPGREGLHYVHKEGCPFMPGPEKRIFLGIFRSAGSAIAEGKKHYCSAARCVFCSKEHRRGAAVAASSEMPYDKRILSSSRIRVTYESAFLCSVN